MKTKEELFSEKEKLREEYSQKEQSGAPIEERAKVLLDYLETDEEIIMLEQPEKLEEQIKFKIEEVKSLNDAKNGWLAPAITGAFLVGGAAIMMAQSYFSAPIFITITGVELLALGLMEKADLKEKLEQAKKDL